MRPACYDSENAAIYCDECAPDIEPNAMPQECDTPLHCDVCGAPVEYSLTPDGVLYVMDAIHDALQTGLDDSVTPDDRLPYYADMPHCSIVGDWARDIRRYGGLSEEDSEAIDHYLELCESIERRIIG